MFCLHRKPLRPPSCSSRPVPAAGICVSLTSVSGIAEGAEEQRHVVVLRWRSDFKNNRDAGVEARQSQTLKISAAIEGQAIDARHRNPIGRHQVAASLFVGDAAGELPPFSSLAMELEDYRDPRGGLPAAGVQNMGADRAH